MKKSIINLAVALVWGCTLSAQSDTLGEALVWDSLYEKLSIGQNVVQLHLDERFSPAGATLGEQLSLGSPLNQYGAGAGLLSNASLRGNHADGTQVFWNGMPSNSPLLGTSDLNLFSAASFDQVSVISGGNGSELGSGAVGGSVLLKNELNFRKQKSLEAQLGVGSFGRKTARVSHQNFGDEFSYQFNAMAMGAENDFPFTDAFGNERKLSNSNLHHATLQFSAGKKWSPSRKLESHFMAQDIFRQIPASSVVFNPQNPEDAWESDQQLRWQNIYQHKKLRVEQGFGLELQHYRRNVVQGGVSVPQTDSRNDFFQSSTEIRYAAAKGKNWQWDVGTYLNYYEAFGSNVQENQLEYGAQTGFTYRPAPRVLSRLSVSENLVDEKHMALLPSLALEYYVNEFLTLKTRHNGIFHNPTLNERYWPGGGNENLLPEKGYNGELSAVTNIRNTSTNWQTTLTLFHQNIENKVVWLPNQFTYSPYNINRTRNQGVELYTHVKKDLGAGTALKAGVNASYIDARVINGSSGESFKEGNQLVFVPRWLAGSWANYKLNALEVFFSGNFNSGAHTTTDNDPFYKLEEFVVLNAGASYRFKFKKWSLTPALQVRNLTNTAYELNSYRPMPGINYIFTLNFSTL